MSFGNSSSSAKTVGIGVFLFHLTIAVAAFVPADILVHVNFRSIDSVLADVGIQLGETLAKYPLPTCCYDDVEVKHVHLNFESMTMSNVSSVDISMGANDEKSLAFDASIASVFVDGFYRLCVHDSPFSKHACSTLFGCKDNFVFGTTKMGASFEITPTIDEQGHLKLAMTSDGATVSAGAIATTLCSKFKDEINPAIAKAIPNVETTINGVVGGLLANVTAAIPYNKTILFADLDWKFIASNDWLSADGSGASLALAVDVASAATNEKAPFRARSFLPDDAVDADLLFRFDDSLVSNVVWTLWRTGFIEYDSTIPILGKNCSVKATLPQAPQFDARPNSTLEVNLTSVNLTFTCEGSSAPFSCDVYADASAQVSVNTSNYLVPQVSRIALKNHKDSDAACGPLIASVGAFVESSIFIDSANDFLRSKAPHIPSTFALPNGTGYVDLTGVDVSSADGYFDLRVETLNFTLAPNALNISLPPLTCPPGPMGGHADACI